MWKGLKRFSVWLAAAIFLTCAVSACRSVSAAALFANVPTSMTYQL